MVIMEVVTSGDEAAKEDDGTKEEERKGQK